MGNAQQKSEERRSYRRISDAIGLRVDIMDAAANESEIEPVELPDYPTHVVSLSPNGLKCYHTDPFNDGDQVRLTMRLFPEQTVIEMVAEVVSAGEDRTRSKTDRFFAGLAFREVSKENHDILLEHIDLVARQSFGGAVKLVN
ncbi:MAG: PilZ domain-containing protein [Pseudomonadota bacterium]